VGDLLVTSGLGNRFPEGYPVARVVEVFTEDGQSYARVTAQPLAALDRIRYLLLIWPSPDSGVTLPNQVPVPAADHPAQDVKPDTSNGTPTTQGGTQGTNVNVVPSNPNAASSNANGASNAATTQPPAEVH